MSTPPYLGLPPGTCRVERRPWPRASLAALEACPAGGVETRAEVICVPGFTGSKEDFLPMFEQLGRAGIRVLSFDQRGQCDSPGLPLQKPYTLDGFGEDLRELITQRAEAGIPVHLLGHSFGGYVARQALASGPSLPLATVTLLLALGPGARRRVPPPTASAVASWRSPG